jgi:hypothetical protein
MAREDGWQVTGAVQDLAVKGCGATFTSTDYAPAELGEKVQLEFSTLLLLEPLRAEAVVRRVTSEETGYRVGFEFCDPDRLQSEIPYVLMASFNRRKEPRVPIDDIVEVAVRALEERDLALLTGVSAGGLSLRISPDFAMRLEENERVELRFRLPEHPPGFWLLGIVRGTWSAGDYVGCSIQFDEETTVDFEKQRAILEQVVARRQKPAEPVDKAGGPS